MTYVRRKASLLEAFLVAHETWRRMSPPQRAALQGSTEVHPATARALRHKRLIDKRGQPTVWGRDVLRFTESQRGTK